MTTHTHISHCEDITEWSVSGTATEDADVKVEGEKSIKITSTNGAATTIDKAYSPAYDLTDTHLGLWLKVDDVDNLEQLSIYLRSVDGSWTHYFVVGLGEELPWLPDGWYYVLNEKYFGKGGTPSWSDINLIRVFVNSKAGKTVNVWVDDFRQIVDEEKAKVTFRFDDSYDHAYTIAKPLLDKYSAAGIVACITGRIGTEAGYLTLTELTELQEAGWDIVSHYTRDVSFETLPEAEWEAELRDSQAWLMQNGFTSGARFLIPGAHKVPYAAMTLIQKYYLAVAWTVGYQPLPPENTYTMRTQMGDDKTYEELKAIVDEAIRTHTWIIFYWHTISDAEKSTISSLLDYLDENEDDIDIVTFSDVWPLVSTAFRFARDSFDAEDFDSDDFETFEKHAYLPQIISKLRVPNMKWLKRIVIGRDPDTQRPLIRWHESEISGVLHSPTVTDLPLEPGVMLQDVRKLKTLDTVWMFDRIEIGGELFEVTDVLESWRLNKLLCYTCTLKRIQEA